MTRSLRVAGMTAAALTVLGTTELLLARALRTQWQTVVSPGPASLDEALTLVVLSAAVVLGGWLLVSTLASLLAHLPGRLGRVADRCARAWAPACSRRVAAVLVGAAVGGALAPGTAVGHGAGASPAAGPGFSQTVLSTAGPGFSSTTATARDGAQSPESVPGFTTTPPAPPQPGWTPTRPTQRPQPAADLVTGRSPGDAAAEVVVHRGDTLWDIARRHLGPDATDAEVARAWPAWYDANRSVIGDDPDLIRPGQVLQRPSASTVASSGSTR